MPKICFGIIIMEKTAKLKKTSPISLSIIVSSIKTKNRITVPKLGDDNGDEPINFKVMIKKLTRSDR